MPKLKPTGLLGNRGYGEGLHLFHATEAPLVVHTPAEEQAARSRGYGDEYIPQEYPKQVGNAVYHNAAEEAAAAPKKGKKGGE